MGRFTKTAGVALLAMVAGVGGAVAGNRQHSGFETNPTAMAQERAATAELELRQVLAAFSRYENSYREARLRGMRATTDADRNAAESDRAQAQEWVRLYGNIVEVKMRAVENAERELALVGERQVASRRR
jgi:hypothetical protein